METKKIIELVKQLRRESGAGVMECKQVLEETRGDLEKAKQILRQRVSTYSECCCN